MKLFGNFSRFLWAESADLLKSRKKAAFIFIVPFVLLFIVALIYSKGSARELPVGIQDNDRSSMSRMIIRSLDAAGSMQVTKFIDDRTNIQKSFLANDVYGVFVIPKDFEKNIRHGDPASIIFYKNSMNLIISNSLLSDANNVVRTISAGVLLQKLQGKGFTYQQALSTVKPTKVILSAHYNPYYNYEYFIVIPVFIALLQMIVAVLGVFYGFGLKSKIAAGNYTSGAKFSNYAAVLVMIFCILAIELIAADIIMELIFGVTLAGRGITLLILTLLFLETMFLLGIVLGHILKSPSMAVTACIFVLTPAFIFSGYTFPVEAMPTLLRGLAECSPYTHYLRYMVSIGYMNNSPGASAGSLIFVASLFGVLFTAGAFLTCRKRTAI